MNNTKTSLGLAAAFAAATTFVFAACGDTMMMQPTTCSSDTQCAASEACHPVLRRCVTACTAGTDCPDSAKTCATFGGLAAGNDAGVRAFCQCATDQLCDRGTAGQVCQPATKICAAKCTSSAGCPSGSTCDTATGKCGAATSGGDGGTDGGTMMVADAGPCSFGSCTSPQICNPSTSACGAAPACAAANPQPDTCAYGLTCSGAACAEAPRTGVGCANFATVTTPTLWNPVGLTAMAGPVTVSVANRADDNAFCTNSVAFSGSHEMYAAPLSLGGTNFPAAGVMLPAGLVNYVRSDGQICDVQRGCANGGQIFRPSGYMVSNGNKNLTLNFTLCAMTGTTALRAGFYCENGNAVCADMN